jgi:hypothetical protein
VSGEDEHRVSNETGVTSVGGVQFDRRSMRGIEQTRSGSTPWLKLLIGIHSTSISCENAVQRPKFEVTLGRSHTSISRIMNLI